MSARDGADRIYRHLRLAILSGKFEVGEVLTQVRLAKDYATSRGPVREALRMLHADGLVEMETNQRGKVATFGVLKLEQACAQLVLNVPAAIIYAGNDALRTEEKRLCGIVDRLEQLSTPNTRTSEQRRLVRRQLTFRKLIRHLCKPAGVDVVEHIDRQLDRLALIRQMIHMSGTTPPYPLPDRLPELTEQITAHDAPGVARLVYELIFQISKSALAIMSPTHRLDLLESYAGCAAAFCAPPGASPSHALLHLTYSQGRFGVEVAED